MKIKIALITIFCLVGFSNFAYASDIYAVRKFAREYEQEIKENVYYEKNKLELQKHAWELGTEVSHIAYKEPDVMEEKGMMYGVTGSCTYRDLFMLKADTRFAYGQVDYKNSGTMDNINDYILELRGLGGYDFPVLKASILTPYIGIGYRYLNDDMTGTTSTGALGYERESNYFYSPIGIETITELDKGWSVGTMLEYDIFWWGEQKSHLSDARCYHSTWGYYTYNDIENRQDKGYGIRGSIKFLKNGEKLDFVIEPFIRYWNIKESKEVTTSTVSEDGLWIITGTFVEPKNNSTEIGCKLAVKF